MEATESMLNNGEDKRLPLVEDLMTTDLYTLYEEDNLKMAKEMMTIHDIRHVPVINSKDELIGIVTQRDLLDMSLSGITPVSESEKDRFLGGFDTEDIMKTAVATVPPKTTLKSAAKLMYENKFGCLPVISGGKLVGILTEADFMKFFMEWDVFER